MNLKVAKEIWPIKFFSTRKYNILFEVICLCLKKYKSYMFVQIYTKFSDAVIKKKKSSFLRLVGGGWRVTGDGWRVAGGGKLVLSKYFVKSIFTGLPVAQPSYKRGLVFPSGTNCTLVCSARAQDVRVCVD